MQDRAIGIIDSGVGGLTIWREIVRELPTESTIYIADSSNCPYGEKTKEQVYELAKRLVESLIKQGVKLIVVACNTATVACLDQLRADFPDTPMVGTVPVVKTAAAVTKNGAIGILSTSMTSGSEYQKKLIQEFAPHCRVTTVGTDELVPYIERGETDTPEFKVVLAKDLTPFVKAQVDAIALGCSHFPFITKQIQEILGPSVNVLDSGAAIGRQVRRVLENNHQLANNNPSYIFYTTGDQAVFQAIVDRVVDNKERIVEHISL